MKLTSEQISGFNDQGFLMIENIFTPAETAAFLEEMGRVIQKDSPRRILEKNGSVRTYFAPHLDSAMFDKIHRTERLAGVAAQLLGTDVYLHQSKINVKAAMLGDWWEWHQDYPYWKNDDGMPEDRVLTAMIFLNDVNEYNGPMLLIPGSHKNGVMDDKVNEPDYDESDWYNDYIKQASYMTSLTADLKYKLERETIAKWIVQSGIVSAKCGAGSVLFFHGNVFHASSNNLSPWDRCTYLLTYNSMENTLADIPAPRPEYLANRTFEPIVPSGAPLV